MASKILLLSDDPSDAEALDEALCQIRDGAFEMQWLRQMPAALERLRAGGIDAAVVDLALAGGNDMAIIDRLLAAAPKLAIVVLVAPQGCALAMKAIERGARGHLPKGFLGNPLVPQILRGIIERKAAEDLLDKERARAEITLNTVKDAVIGIDLSGNVDYLNIAAEKITGWPYDQARGWPVDKVFRLVHGITRQEVRNIAELTLQWDQTATLPANAILIRRDGSEAAIENMAAPIRERDGQLAGGVIVFHDVSAAQAMAAKMAHLAQHDFLTNLPNRALLNDRIAQAITMTKRHGVKLAVLFLDLDNFKHINDSLGHTTGDKLLQSVAQRLGYCVRSSDTVSRQGGDEFVILLAESKNENDAAVTAEKILAALALPHHVSNSELHVTTSIGISVYPQDGQDAQTLIKSADTAMYHAKESGRNNYQFFKSHMNVRAVERQFIETGLRRSLERQEFVLHYQPKVNLKTGLITGTEALLRWLHADWGMVYPDRFLSIAQDCGLIVPIGQWVLREACTQARRWCGAGLAPVSIAVNISAPEFHQKNFLENVRAALDDSGLEAGCLELEFTESALMCDAVSSTAILQQLKEMGVRLTVDDFGTGYSSLSCLKQFPVDVLKIDQSFVHDIDRASDEGFIVSAVIGMGNSLKMRVVAEGVENQAQLAFLKARHCQEGQGYLFGRPLLAPQFTALLEKRMPDAARFRARTE